MVRIIIKAVKEQRPYCIKYLQHYLPQAEWCFDKTQDHMDTFLEALRMAGTDACVHMEEDVRLTVGFADKLQAEISQRPQHVIQFFSMRKADIETGSRWDNDFLMNQCTYFPAGYSQDLLGYYDAWRVRWLKDHPNGSDLMIKHWLKYRKEKYWIVCPNLVDHRIGVSVINSKRSSKRQSKTFLHPVPELEGF